MNLKPDSYFEIGSTHDICQDYALSGNINNIAFAIITDGCSESHKKCGEVDFGARVVAYSARDAIYSLFLNGPESLPMDFDKCKSLGTTIRQNTLVNIKPIKERLRLHEMFADSTLVIALTDGKTTYAFIFGDGGIITTYKNGKILYDEMNFTSSAPYYIVYTEDTNRNNGYKSKFGKDPAFHNQYIIEANKEVVVNKRQAPEINEKIYEFSSFMYTDISSITVTSDGIKSYQNLSGAVKDIIAEKMVPRFVSFKSNVGCYSQRRMKTLKKECDVENIAHYDDISTSTILIDG